jgi:hypothetical protein
MFIYNVKIKAIVLYLMWFAAYLQTVFQILQSIHYA